MQRLPKKPRKQIAAAIIVSLTLSTAMPALSSSASSSSKELTVGVPVDRCPVFYQDPETNEVVGIGADLMRIAAEDAGYQVILLPITEESLKEALDNQAYDAVLPFGSAIPSAGCGLQKRCSLRPQTCL